MKGILGKKVGMTQVFTKDGKLIPVTVVKVEENIVYQVKTIEKDGYNSVKLGTFDKKKSRINKPEEGNANIAKTTPKRFLKEIRDFEGDVKVGDKIEAGIFNVGEIVDVTGISKGKGFQGVIKRHNYARGPMSHGSHHHRKPGSLGSVAAKRVFKGTKLPGHMGFETVTIQNLEIIEVNEQENYILISGSVPGAKGTYIVIKTAVKGSRKENIKEILKYTEDTVEVVEQETEVVEQETEEPVVQEEVQEEVTTEEAVEEVEEPKAEEEPAETNKE